MRQIITETKSVVKSVRPQISFFDSIGCSFVPNGKKSKRPIHDNWQNNPQTAKEIEKHTGNIGIALGKHSGGIICFDADVRFPEFINRFPFLKESTIITRKDAPGRGKVLVRVTDSMPRSTNHKIEGDSKPVFELLANGKQAVVIGINPHGCEYECNNKQPVELKLGEVSAIYRQWTGVELPSATRQKKSIDLVESDNVLAKLVKKHWTCKEVFRHFGWGETIIVQRNGETRLANHGGLLIREDRDVFYNHTEEVGGDCIAAWAWVKLGKPKLEKEEFVAVCKEMLDVVGVEMPSFKSELAFSADTARAWASTASNFPKDRYNAQNRAASTYLIEKMIETGKNVISMSVRDLAEHAGMSDITAHRTIKRLIAYGHIERITDVGNYMDGDIENVTDKFTSNQLSAFQYKLTQKLIDQLSELNTCDSISFSATHVLSSCTSKSQSISHRYMDHDAFQYGAEVADSGLKMGKASLDLVAALAEKNEQTSEELAEITGRSRQSCAEKMGVLVMLGIAESYRFGKQVRYYLVDAWEDVLYHIVKSMSTLGATTKRKIRHIEARLVMLDRVLNRYLSEKMRNRIADMIKELRKNLFALNRQLGQLMTMRQEMFAS